MSINENLPELVSIEQAAKKLGTTVVNVLMQIKQKRLTGREIDGVWHVTAESLARLLQEGSGPVSLAPCRGHCANGSRCRSGDQDLPKVQAEDHRE